jgi:hypothetical protein
MSDLTEAAAALAAGQAAHNTAVHAASAAASTAAGLRASISAGNTDITPGAMAKADQAAEHAQLVAEGAQRALPVLQAAVQATKAEETCDRIAGGLPVLGARVAAALDGLSEALGPLVAAVSAYDQFADQAVRELNRSAHGTTSRVILGHYSTPTVDRISLGSCRGPAQLAAVLTPALIAMGAPSNLIEGLRFLAEGAPTLPAV